MTASAGRGCLGEVLVGDAVLGEPSSAGGDVAEVAVEHGDGGGGVLDEGLEAFLGGAAGGDVGGEGDESGEGG